jgi:xylulokinase
MLDAFHDAGVESNRLVAIGGRTKGGLCTQIVSDVTGNSNVVRRTLESS